MDEDRGFIQEILKNIYENSILYNYPSSRRSSKKTEEKSLYEQILLTREDILNAEHNKEENYSYAYDHIMIVATTSSHKWEKRKWIALSEALQMFFKNNGYWILKIVDGVDNIHIR